MAPPPEDKERLEQHSADVEKFIELLVAAASGAGSRASVVLTVRADFYNPLIRNPLIAALLPKQQVNIPPMSRDDLRSAIETPAKTAGLSFAPPQLVDRILDDVGLEEGRLPLLQFALKETWQRREGDKLTAEAYTAVGGVAGAIEKTAEDAYERLTPSQKDAARRLFLRLVTPGEGQADTRARSVIPDDPEQRDIVSLFANPKTRLLVTGYETLQGAARAGGEARATVEVAHEALIQRWPTLRDWVRANRENMRARAAILRAKAEWEEHGQDEKFLLDPGRPARARPRLARQSGRCRGRRHPRLCRPLDRGRGPPPTEREADLADQKRIVEAERKAREAAEEAAREAAARVEIEAKLRAAAERTLSVWGRVAGALAVGLVVGVPWYLFYTAHMNSMRAHAQAIADRAEYSLGNEGPAKALLVASLAEKLGLPDLPKTERVLIAALRQLHERREISGLENPVSGIAFSPDGTVIASLDNASIVFRGAEKGETIAEVSLPERAKFGLTWSVAGDWLGVNYEHKALLLRPCSRQEIRHLFPSCEPGGKDETVTLGGSLNAGGLPKFSSDGKWAVTASRIQPPVLWDIATQTATPLATPIPAMPFGVSISPDGAWIAVGLANSEIDLVDPKHFIVQTLQRKAEEPASVLTVVLAVEFNTKDPNMLAASLQNGEILVWNIRDRTFETLAGSGGIAYNLSFSQDGRYLAASSDDRVIRIWRTDRIASKEKPTQLRGHAGPVYLIAYNPVSNTLVSGSPDRTIRIWDEHSPLARSEDGQSQVGVGANSSEPPSWISSVDLPLEFGEVTAYAEDGDRAILASKDGNLALFIVGMDRNPIVNWRSAEPVAALGIEHGPDRIVATSISGKRYSWPFLPNIHALVQFADDHIPFDGDHRQALSDEEKCFIDPPDEGCKADDALSDPLRQRPE